MFLCGNSRSGGGENYAAGPELCTIIGAKKVTLLASPRAHIHGGVIGGGGEVTSWKKLALSAGQSKEFPVHVCWLKIKLWEKGRGFAYPE